MDQVTLARWQFGITTVYHYLFVPITIALSMMVAVLQTIWYKTGEDRFLQLTKFFGKLFLINFALGVVTGIVQEFQFGMNWSEYSRFVGDIFGAPLALEALLAFFLESTFIGLWIFGWDKLPKKLHLTAIYCAAIGTMLSAVFILAANSWMQNPVGSVFNVESGRAEIDGVTGFGALFTNPVFVATILHTLTAAYMVAGGLIAGVSAWHLAKLNKAVDEGAADAENHIRTWRWATKLGAWVMLVASVGVILSGDLQAKAIAQTQPMKLAAAEGLFETEKDASFSILTIGNKEQTEPVFEVKVPKLLSILAGQDEVKGINELDQRFQDEGYFMADEGRQKLQDEVYQAVKNGEISPELHQSYLDLNYRPDIVISYWTFRVMMGLGFVTMAIGVWILVALRGGRNPKPSKWLTTMAFALPLLPLFANSFGWIFTEMGRQPWIVVGVLPTASAVSPTVSNGEVLFSMIVYTLIYGGLAVLEVWLFLKFVRKGLPEAHPVEVNDDPDKPMSFAY
ncbi:cytochrome ubiquinol oxidase subunit I [uncultured Tessaracoccus sp.]|uniref:cytochrome ubiquinol oxidase subunit I n=1 Tax=uncultured Tessaracoccus sp. TaxID=905023 RepID=UPI0025FC0E8B|nr:cytochrome ubiquinol oxidase subunit I [uncultured Tessaracoccus sp.]